MHDLVSVIVPVYNVEKYLEKCVDSLISQTYNNVEIILVDDGSTDMSGEICDQYADRDERIVVIHQHNKGLSGARNAALSICKGKFITCVDSDDFVDISLIERLYNVLLETNTDISECGCFLCDDEDERIGEETSDKQIVLRGIEQLKGLFNDKYVTTSAWGKLYKRELFDGILYPEGQLHEDINTTYKLYEKANSTVVIPEALYWYRANNQSITRRPLTKRNMDLLYANIDRAEDLSIKYPELSSYAYAAVAHSACRLFKRMIDSEMYEINMERTLRRAVKGNIIDMILKSRCKMTTKFFALTFCISPKLCRKISKRLR